MISPEVRDLLRRWLKDSETDEHNDADPDTMRLVYETRIVLGVDVKASRAGLAELERPDGDPR